MGEYVRTTRKDNLDKENIKGKDSKSIQVMHADERITRHSKPKCEAYNSG